MSLLANLTTDESIANEKDSVGGSGPVDSGVYSCTVSMAHIIKSQGGAMGFNDAAVVPGGHAGGPVDA